MATVASMNTRALFTPKAPATVKRTVPVKKAAPIVKKAVPVKKVAPPVKKAVVPPVKKAAPIVKKAAPIVRKAAPIVRKAASPTVRKAAPVKRAAAPVKQLDLKGIPTLTIQSSKDPTKGEYSGYALGLYPEWGTYPGSGLDDTWLKLEDTKNIERETIHGRFAMLAVAGVMAQENLGMGPWYDAGTTCTPGDCTFTYLNQSIDLKSEGFIAVLAAEILLVGGAEAYRTGLLENPFAELTVGNVYPGGRFDPFNLGDKQVGGTIDELKLKELKHSRLAMFAWLGIISQAVATHEGPMANRSEHLADPAHANIIALFNSTAA
jgi:hypothetical protein